MTMSVLERPDLRNVKSYNRTLTIRQLMSKSPQAVLDNLKKGLNVTYDDNITVPMTHREAITTRILLTVAEVLGVENITIPSKFTVTNYYSNGSYKSSTFNSFFSDLLRHIVNEYLRDSDLSRSESTSDLYEQMYKAVNFYYNEVVEENIDYVMSADIRNYLELSRDSRLVAAMNNCKKLKTIDSISETYTVMDIVLRDKKYEHNPIAESYVSGGVNPNQMKQMLGARGHLIELSSQIFKIPVTSGYVEGMKSIYEMAVESRTGAMALHVSKVAVEKSEYFAREWQIVTGIVKRLYDSTVVKDCGSTNYMLWKVREDTGNGQSDLVTLDGKYFFNEDTKRLEVVTTSRTDLIGKNIKIRSAHKCCCKDSGSICQTCFGDLSFSIFNHTSLGNICSSTISGIITQLMLSYKHLTNSAKGGKTSLSNEALKLFTIKNTNRYHFRSNQKDRLAKKRHVLLVDGKEAANLKDIDMNTDMEAINPARYTRKINNFQIEVFDNKGESIEITDVEVRKGNTYGVFTKEMLKHIQRTGFTLDSYGRISIDLTGWDVKDPLLYTPEMQFNYLELSKEVKGMYKYLKEPENIDAMIMKTYDAINSKLSINLALMEVVAYAFSTYDIDNNDYRLARNSPNPKVARMSEVINNRSLSSVYAWEDNINTILSPKSFYSNNAIDNPLDVYIDPKGTIERWKEEVY